MANAFATPAKNIMLDDFGPSAAYLGVHNVSTPTDGTSEATGGSPAYARKAISFGAASGGVKALSAPVTFDVPPMTVRAVALWSAPTGGTFYGYWTMADEVYPIQGTLTVQSGQLAIT